MTITYQWRGDFDNAAVNALHAEAFGHGQTATDWHTRVHRHSLGWVCARKATALVGFVNVAWDGGAFEPDLRPFSFEACGFRPTDAGLIALR
ncbi:hypothetical protein ABH926_009032 [Catenulispora sp. GP43]|uniref:hypothetical protein n=1 Tax=Catenulispora sp. GP43 TaxID=3156263 RepID=UPI0035183084